MGAQTWMHSIQESSFSESRFAVPPQKKKSRCDLSRLGWSQTHPSRWLNSIFIPLEARDWATASSHKTCMRFFGRTCDSIIRKLQHAWSCSKVLHFKPQVWSMPHAIHKIMSDYNWSSLWSNNFRTHSAKGL